MSLTGQTVRIVVSEPWDWEENLFGIILSDRGGDKLLIRLTKPIKGKKMTSDLIELTPRHEKKTFKPLGQYYSVSVGGSLTTIDRTEFDYVVRAYKEVMDRLEGYVTTPDNNLSGDVTIKIVKVGKDLADETYVD